MAGGFGAFDTAAVNASNMRRMYGRVKSSTATNMTPCCALTPGSCGDSTGCTARVGEAAATVRAATSTSEPVRWPIATGKCSAASGALGTVASGFSRKIIAGSLLPPKGGSHMGATGGLQDAAGLERRRDLGGDAPRRAGEKDASGTGPDVVEVGQVLSDQTQRQTSTWQLPRGGCVVSCVGRRDDDIVSIRETL